MIKRIKRSAAQLLEKHPAGYAAGVFLLDHCDFLLPHEAEYWGFPALIRRGWGRYRRILDLGANRGHSARAFLKMMPGWEVVSIEANPVHRASLERVKKRHRDRFDFQLCAAGEESGGELAIHTPFYGPFALHSATATTAAEAARAVAEAYPRLAGRFRLSSSTVPVRAIDDLGLRVDFVKIDIQGDELKALRGMRRTLEGDRPILLAEVNNVRDPVARFLEELDYRPWHFSVESGEFEPGFETYDAHKRNAFFIPDRHLGALGLEGRRDVR